jgi:hypothetical protein
MTIILNEEFENTSDSWTNVNVQKPKHTTFCSREAA